jgi:F-type H+-transporting ATPase subunit c
MAAAKYVGAGLAAIGLTGAGGQLFTYAILGFALAEATGLFALMVSFLVLYS